MAELDDWNFETDTWEPISRFGAEYARVPQPLPPPLLALVASEPRHMALLATSGSDRTLTRSGIVRWGISRDVYEGGVWRTANPHQFLDGFNCQLPSEPECTSPGVYSSSNCAFCKSNLRELSACDRCHRAFYCTKTCREDDASIHDSICPGGNPNPHKHWRSIWLWWTFGVTLGPSHLRRAVLLRDSVLVDFLLRMGVPSDSSSCMYGKCGYDAEVVRVLKRHGVAIKRYPWTFSTESKPGAAISFLARNGMLRDLILDPGQAWGQVERYRTESGPRGSRAGTFGQTRILVSNGIDASRPIRVSRHIRRCTPYSATHGEYSHCVDNASDALEFAECLERAVAEGTNDKKLIDERRAALPSVLFSMNIIEQLRPLLDLVVSYDYFCTSDLPFWQE